MAFTLSLVLTLFLTTLFSQGHDVGNSILEYKEEYDKFLEHVMTQNKKLEEVNNDLRIELGMLNHQLKRFEMYDSRLGRKLKGGDF